MGLRSCVAVAVAVAWPGNLHMLWMQPLKKKREREREKRTKSFQEILSDPVSCPARVSRLTLLRLTPKPYLMEAVRSVYAH